MAGLSSGVRKFAESSTSVLNGSQVNPPINPSPPVIDPLMTKNLLAAADEDVIALDSASDLTTRVLPPVPEVVVIVIAQDEQGSQQSPATGNAKAI